VKRALHAGMGGKNVLLHSGKKVDVLKSFFLKLSTKKRIYATACSKIWRETADFVDGTVK
jgi:hypothetical protein